MKDLAIIGAGAAGMTAAIYAGRSGLDVELLEGGVPGGQTLNASLIENWPGYRSILGPDLSANFQDHTQQYVEIQNGIFVEDIEKIDGGFRMKTTAGEREACAIIIATGADHRKLDVPGEEELAGKGVSYCATCDGFFFKNRKVLLVGGGNTAIIDAIYLHDAGVEVEVVHRRDSLRAEKSLQEQLFERDIKVHWKTVVKEIKGTDMVESVVIDTEGTEQAIEVAGIFAAVGLVPKNLLAKKLELELDRFGYIVVTRKMRTSMPMVYAAGDIVGGLQQVITSCAEGAIAATTAYTDIKTPYWADDAPE